MKNLLLLITTICTLIIFIGCSRKTNPEKRSSSYEPGGNKKAEPVKTVSVTKIKTAIPKVIVVNDAVANKTFDGKYYYDLEGRRYWRSKKDGKYYLYNKSMATDPDFKKP